MCHQCRLSFVQEHAAWSLTSILFTEDSKGLINFQAAREKGVAPKQQHQKEKMKMVVLVSEEGGSKANVSNIFSCLCVIIH